ncbi:hypothetical protein CONPUDRAFT_155296 [Coniophora puteana RWD-64-598 SS2]|uniref:Uncharacterized protein n=1 Tax=Coniophora puteana (strain RWD-64-598) TaxID=741705 RepID=A0A5M3MLP9_CONPW|nr:uncharacterized protein CONPUDRAFT_155296 [Coniophora puteana RWD-64-598 SS2]EIW79900.1 hypothetical protein CONPUDRAFT_155296 [Coniophora puteana RWD-64-598 SS2]
MSENNVNNSTAQAPAPHVAAQQAGIIVPGSDAPLPPHLAWALQAAPSSGIDPLSGLAWASDPSIPLDLGDYPSLVGSWRSTGWGTSTKAARTNQTQDANQTANTSNRALTRMNNGHNNNYKFIEDQHGNAINGYVLRELLKYGRRLLDSIIDNNGLGELHARWSDVPLQECIFFWYLFEKQYPVLRFCSAHWKCDKIGSRTYTNWRKQAVIRRRRNVAAGTAVAQPAPEIQAAPSTAAPQAPADSHGDPLPLTGDPSPSVLDAQGPMDTDTGALAAEPNTTEMAAGDVTINLHDRSGELTADQYCGLVDALTDPLSSMDFAVEPSDALPTSTTLPAYNHTENGGEAHTDNNSDSAAVCTPAKRKSTTAPSAPRKRGRPAKMMAMPKKITNAMLYYAVNHFVVTVKGAKDECEGRWSKMSDEEKAPFIVGFTKLKDEEKATKKAAKQSAKHAAPKPTEKAATSSSSSTLD